MQDDTTLPAVTDLAGMAEILMVGVSSLAKVWRTWPHFFVGNGRTAVVRAFALMMSSNF